MSGANVGQLLLDAATRWPTREALIDVGAGALGIAQAPRLTWAELASQARAVAAELATAGVGIGDVVGLVGRNDAAYVVRWFGVVLAGCTLAPLPALSAPDEIAWRAAHAAMRLLLHDDATATLVDEARARFGHHGCKPEIWGAIAADQTAATAATTIGVAPAATAASDAALLLYTSGTTGRSKGALISHGTLLRHSHNVTVDAVPLGIDDVVFAALPFSHSFGCRMVMLACTLTGAKMVIVRRFSAVLAWRVLREAGVTWLPVVPTMLAALVREPPATARLGVTTTTPEPAEHQGAEPNAHERPRLPHLRWCLSAGATLPEARRVEASAALGVPVYQGYGMTEATFSAIDHPPADPTPGSVGRPTLGVHIRVVAPDGTDAPVGERGEIWIRGDNTFLRYLHDPAATREVVQRGWVRSGDVGVISDEGRLAIVDRLKDLIVRGGYNVYPSEVEAALVAHPSVHQVAVVGIPDDYQGEEVVAVIVATADLRLSDLDAWARARLARYKVPRRYARIDAMPLGPSRKVLKRVLRQQLDKGQLASALVSSSGRAV